MQMTCGNVAFLLPYIYIYMRSGCRDYCDSGNEMKLGVDKDVEMNKKVIICSEAVDWL